MKTMTIKEFMDVTGHDQPTANGLLNGLLDIGVITSPGSRKEPGKKGKAPVLFDIPEGEISINLFAKAKPKVKAETPEPVAAE